jgi:pimeloyl-ACP methyl ester carboxylesterase
MRRAFLEMLYPKSYLGSVDQNALAAELAPILGRDLADSPSIMMKQLGAMRAYDRSADLGKLSGIPTLVASAQDDPIALPEFGRTLANSISGARYTEYQRASHAVILQTPDELNSTLRLHFDRVESIAAQAARMMP